MSGLKRRHRRVARQIAHESFLRCDGDLETAKNYFNSHPLVCQIDPSLIVLMLQIAIQLWQLWQSRNETEPSVVATNEESSILGEEFFDEEPGDD